MSEAEELADQICGCADTRQRKADIAALNAFASRHRARARREALEECVRLAEARAEFYRSRKEQTDDPELWGQREHSEGACNALAFDIRKLAETPLTPTAE